MTNPFTGIHWSKERSQCKANEHVIPLVESIGKKREGFRDHDALCDHLQRPWPMGWNRRTAPATETSRGCGPHAEVPIRLLQLLLICPHTMAQPPAPTPWEFPRTTTVDDEHPFLGISPPGSQDAFSSATASHVPGLVISVKGFVSGGSFWGYVVGQSL